MVWILPFSQTRLFKLHQSQENTKKLLRAGSPKTNTHQKWFQTNDSKNAQLLQTIKQKKSDIFNTWTLVVWNASSLRERYKNGTLELLFADTNADIIIILESKVSLAKFLRKLGAKELLNKYGYLHNYEHSSTNKPILYGYAGVLVFSKHKPSHVTIGINDPRADTEGRCISLHFPHLIITGAYLPNAGSELELKTLDKKLSYIDKFDKFLTMNNKHDKPQLLTGDMNVTVRPEDRHDDAFASKNRFQPSCTQQEREKFANLLHTHKFTDQIVKREDQPALTWFWKPSDQICNKGMRLDHVYASPKANDLIYYSTAYTLHTNQITSPRSPS